MHATKRVCFASYFVLEAISCEQMADVECGGYQSGLTHWTYSTRMQYDIEASITRNVVLVCSTQMTSIQRFRKLPQVDSARGPRVSFYLPRMLQ